MLRGSKKDILGNQNVSLKKSKDKFFDFFIMKNDKKIYIKVFRFKRPYIITFNSKSYIEVKIGRRVGINFRVRGKTLYNIEAYDDHNKIFVFTRKPFKILSYKNESDIENISNVKEHKGVKFYHSMNEVFEEYKYE